MREREVGATYAYSKSDGGACFVLPIGDYPRLREEWMAGKAFYEGETFYGADLTLKLGDIVAISRNSPAALREIRQAQIEARQEDRQDDMLTGR